MSEFDDFIRGIGSDIKNAAEHIGRNAEKTFEVSKRRAEKVRVKGHIQNRYQRLGELAYGSMKNGDDVSEEMKVLIEKLDEDFVRIGELFEEINSIKDGSFVYDEDETDWDEKYAEEYDDVEEIIEEAKLLAKAEEKVPDNGKEIEIHINIERSEDGGKK